MKTQLISIKPKLLIFSILMLCIGVLMASNWSRLEQKIGFKPEFTELPYTSDFNHQHINNDTLPSSYAQQKTIIKKMDGNRSYSIEMENGIIKELEVDGKKINPEEYDQYSDIIEESSPKTGKNGGQMYFFGSPNQDFEQIFEFDNFNFDSIQGRFFGNGFDKKSIEEMQQELLNMQEKMKDFPMQFNFKFLDSMGSQDFVFPDFEEFFRSGESFGMGDKRFEFVYPDGDSGQNNGDRFWKSQDRIQDKMNINNIIGNALNDDGFLIPNQNNVVELTGKYLKINGEKQPTNIWNKYKMIFESETGTRLEKNSKIKFQIVGKQSKRKYKIY